MSRRVRGQGQTPAATQKRGCGSEQAAEPVCRVFGQLLGRGVAEHHVPDRVDGVIVGARPVEVSQCENPQDQLGCLREAGAIGRELGHDLRQHLGAEVLQRVLDPGQGPVERVAQDLVSGGVRQGVLLCQCSPSPHGQGSGGPGYSIIFC